MEQKELKKKLLDLGICVDNEYLDKYVELVCSNLFTISEKGKTQSHHIVPRYYYKMLGEEVDNSKNNLVNLLYKDHILCHCLLCLCSKDELSIYYNFIAVSYVFGNMKDITKRDDIIFEVIKNLDEYQLAYERYNTISSNYNCMYDKDVYEKHNAIMKSEEVRNKISKTLKDKARNNELFTEEHRKHLSDAALKRYSDSKSNGKCKSVSHRHISKSGYIGGVTGLKMIYDTEGKRHYIENNLVESYLSQGWTLPTNKKKTNITNNTTQKHTYTRHMSQEDVHSHLSNSHKGIKPGNYGVPMTEESKNKMRNTVKGKRWMNNGTVQTQVMLDKQEEYLKKGYVYGKLKQ